MLSTSRGDKRFFSIATSLSLGLVAVFFMLLISLIIFSLPSIKAFGFSFLWNDQWNPVTNEFGALSVILGTIITSVIALIIAVPLSLGIAILIDSLLPRKIGQVLARLIELMAGIPSIVYGIWGLFFLLPWIQKLQLKLLPISNYMELKFQTLEQEGSFLFYFKPFVMFFVKALPTGSSVFAASIILAIMVIPLISSIMREVLGNMPDMVKEAAYGTGATHWEVTKSVLLPFAAPGLLGAIILGFGRALGETMAVTFVIGNTHALEGLFMPSTTISATIANEFNEAVGTLYPSVLVETGLILFIISLVILFISRYFLKKSKRKPI
ncbi:phosphate ABC transporter permease subunit PstC [Thiotrichales bacterium 19S11-10]|nr:phosphate ABC transporter permease subunit PstC [Thiotrichales bacterium 19S11-10]MCF6806930.1 phosphate ABC transporter permease subunit PstC [Thiotrichales bacterium 19S9-11]MCF6810899.1 phosphate ABC transporter permease subunit PstC [Thiotrichales bacterium 19S9-12]